MVRAASPLGLGLRPLWDVGEKEMRKWAALVVVVDAFGITRQVVNVDPLGTYFIAP